MKATKEQIKQWLETQIGMMYVQRQQLTLTEKIDYLSDDEGKIVSDVVLKNISSTDYIQLGSESLRYVATELELPVAIIEKDSEDYPYELQFYYNGVRFISIESEEEYHERGELA